MKQKPSYRKDLEEVAKLFNQTLAGSPAEQHLTDRGFNLDQLQPYGLGYVKDPPTGFTQYKNCLSIPYIRKGMDGKYRIVSIRFRNLGEGPKYMTMAGDRPRLYNTQALDGVADVVAVCEGEFDAIAANLSGLSTVGVPGAQSWQKHWRHGLLGYKKVLVIGDGDEAGRSFAQKVAHDLPNSIILTLPDGEDINSLTQKGLFEWQ